jgi:rhodanese-related sulfurtransferase
LLIDIRSDSQRARDGVIPGARFIPRNVLEWRCDPSCDYSDSEVVAEPHRQLIVFCHEGYQSSLAASTLQRFGFSDATDLVGGFQAWRESGLDVNPA